MEAWWVNYEGIAAPFVPHPEVADEVGSTST